MWDTSFVFKANVNAISVVTAIARISEKSLVVFVTISKQSFSDHGDYCCNNHLIHVEFSSILTIVAIMWKPLYRDCQ